MVEEWRPFFEGDYEVSSLGRVRRARPGRRTFAGKIMTPILLKIGYFKVSPTRDGKNVQLLVHRLVAEAFIGPCPPDHEVNHIDGVKTNNRVENLEYVTHAGNMGHAARLGLMPSGERHGAAKLSDARIVEMRRLYDAGETRLYVLAEMFGVARSTVCQIVKRVRRS